MSRKRCHRRSITPMPPKGLRPRLRPDQVRDLGICHLENLDALHSRTADEAALWSAVCAVFTWHRPAELLGAGVPEMEAQLKLATAVIERFGHTGIVELTDAEYELAKDGVNVMDQLAQSVDQFTADTAARWSEAKIKSLSALCAVREAA